MATWVIVVDDDTANLKMAGHILSKNQMRVTALKSGTALLEYIRQHGMPDLILLDIKMPVMDGFETLERLRSYEHETGREDVPVIFLTADEDADTETRGFEVGVSDFIRKPFNPDVLLRRISNIVSKQERMLNFKAEATTDKLTGLLNKVTAKSVLTGMCLAHTGCLMMIDLDSFKLVNDIYGHDMGDKVLVCFSDLLTKHIPVASKAARLGGDEFAAFCRAMNTEAQVAAFTQVLNEELLKAAKAMMGENMEILLGVSVGAVFAPEYGTNYENLMLLADKALYQTKKHGKHGYTLYSPDAESAEPDALPEMDIAAVSSIMGERSIPDVALELDKDEFSYVYRYVMRYLIRNRKSACKMQFILEQGDGIGELYFRELCDAFGEHIKISLRKSDVFMRSRSNRYFVFLTDIRRDAVEKVAEGLISRWKERNGEGLHIVYESEFVGTDAVQGDARRTPLQIAVVTGEETLLASLTALLQAHAYGVMPVTSGEELLSMADAQLPDMILLDAGENGFRTLDQLRCLKPETVSIPIIFMMADDSPENVKKALSLGTAEIIRLPVIPELLLHRIRSLHTLAMLEETHTETKK